MFNPNSFYAELSPVVSRVGTPAGDFLIHVINWGLTPDTPYQLGLDPRPVSSCGSPLAENTGIEQLSQHIHVHRFLPSW